MPEARRAPRSVEYLGAGEDAAGRLHEELEEAAPDRPEMELAAGTADVPHRDPICHRCSLIQIDSYLGGIAVGQTDIRGYGLLPVAAILFFQQLP
jgi:hypothetical protein